MSGGPQKKYSTSLPKVTSDRPQSSYPPMARAPVPEHFRELLRSSMPSEPRPATTEAFMYLPGTPGEFLQPTPHANNQQSRVIQQSATSSDFQRPEANYHVALGEMARTIQHEYSRPPRPTAFSAYAHRQTHQAEYGRPPPRITPPPTTDMKIDPSLRSVSPYQPMAQSSGYQQQIMQSRPYRPAPQPIQVHLPGRQPAQHSFQQPALTPAQHAEASAFDVIPATRLNRYGAPRGYMPALVVEKLQAWDTDGEMLWVPRYHHRRD